MRHPARALFASLAIAAFLAGASAWADEPPAAPQDNSAGQAPEAKHDEPAPKTPADERAELYTRLAASKDADETSGIITRLLHNYSDPVRTPLTFCSSGRGRRSASRTIPTRSKSSIRRSRSSRTGRRAGTPAPPRVTSTTTTRARWPTLRRRSSGIPGISGR